MRIKDCVIATEIEVKLFIITLKVNDTQKSIYENFKRRLQTASDRILKLHTHEERNS